MPAAAQSFPIEDPGFVIQLIRRNDVESVRRLLDTADDDGIEAYIQQSLNGMGVLHWAASQQSGEMMFCLVSRIEDCQHLSDDFLHAITRPAYRVLGLPVIQNYSFKTPLHIAVQNDNPNVIRPIMEMVQCWEISDDFLLKTDPDGYTAVQCAAAKRVDTMNSILENLDPPRAVRLLSHKGKHGWSSLHVSSIKGDTAMMRCILSNFEEEEKQKFICESDNEGWSSLHWAAAQGHTEATDELVDQITHQAQKEMSGVSMPQAQPRAWTVIHACALNKTNCHQTLRSIMRRFDQKCQWKILQCPSVDGKTALHIAVEENNAQAVLMLLDYAGENVTDLLSQQDDSNKTSEAYAVPDNQLAKHLKISAKVGNLALHYAAMIDDNEAVSWILKNSPKRTFVLANDVKNQEGLSALHVASQHNSANAISALLQNMNEEQLVIDSIDHRTTNGDNSMHLASMHNSLAAVNELLFAIDRKQRKTMLRSENSVGKNAASLASESDAMTSLLKGHERYCSGDIQDLFTLELHAFNIDINSRALDKAYAYIEPRVEQIPGFVCHANIAALTCIAKQDYGKAVRLIEAAYALDPDNIHTWVNIGALLSDLNQTDIQQRAMEEAGLTLLRLKADHSALITAKMEYAYWLAETGRGDNDREECCKLMEQCLHNNIPTLKSADGLEMNCRTLYMKTIIRWLKDLKLEDHKLVMSSKWISEKVSQAVDQLIHLYNHSKSDFYQREVLIWLLEIQRVKIQRHCAQALTREMERFTQATGRPTHLEDCVKRVIGYVDIYPDDFRFKSRLGYNCLDIAYQHDTDVNKRKEWLANALKYSSEGNSDENWTFMGASTIAAAQTHIWAIGFYERNKEFIDRFIRRRYNIQQEVHLSNGWRYLTTEFYSSKAENHKGGTACLKKIAHQHEAIIRRHGVYGYETHGLQYARVLCLLGKPKEEVLKVFHNCISIEDKNMIKVLQHRGHYQKVMGDFEKSERDLRRAVQLKYDNNLDLSVALARCDLEHLDQLKEAQQRHQNDRYHEGAHVERTQPFQESSNNTPNHRRGYRYNYNNRSNRGWSESQRTNQSNRPTRGFSSNNRNTRMDAAPSGSWRQQPSGERF